jgi:signal transduction histidine kinase
MLHFPVQLLRAAVGVLATYGLVRAIQLVEQERREMLLAAQAARVEALERVQQELVKREALRREMIQRTVIAQEDERSRIARELHDESAQLLTAISLSLATLRTEIRPERGALILIDRLQDLSRDMSRQMHRMVHDLRPAQLDDLGLVPALQFLVDEGRQSTGVEIKVSVVGQRSKLNKLVETVIFRAVQEALNNIYRHAKVQSAEMIINYSPARIGVTVIDQGVGFDSTKEYEPDRGFGLVGMRERLESVRGTLKVQSSLGEGTKIEIAVPLTEKDLIDLIEENRYGSTHPNYAG